MVLTINDWGAAVWANALDGRLVKEPAAQVVHAEAPVVRLL
jgi:hypothetical protein